jgi:hypothetical protein
MTPTNPPIDVRRDSWYASVPTMRLPNWGAFHNAVDSLNGWIFRGQGAADWPRTRTARLRRRLKGRRSL